MSKIGIICVDDEKIIIDSLKSLLSSNLKKEYIIEFAESSEEVLEVIDDFEKEKIEFALIISDYIMPKVKGDELLISLHKKFPNTKKIMLTGQADLNGIEKLINNTNLYRFISKPWNNDDLLLTINEAMKGYENEKAIKEHTKILEKTVDEKTKELQEYLEILNEHVMVVKTDSEKNIIDLSKAFLKFSGYNKNDLMGKNYNELLFSEEGVELYDKMWKEVDSKKIWKGEIQIIKNTGKKSWLNTTLTSSNEKNKTIYNIIKHDISDKKKIEELVIKDPMTNLYNRRFFNQIFPIEIHRAKRENNFISFITLDVDNFKLYNDNYGHQMGDEVLIKIADILKKVSKRASDYPIRLGGEEFGIIFSGQNQEETIKYANCIKEKIEQLGIEHRKNGEQTIVTASFGLISLIPNKGMTMDKIYNSADNALYDAKSLGRNKVILGNCEI